MPKDWVFCFGCIELEYSLSRLGLLFALMSVLAAMTGSRLCGASRAGIAGIGGRAVGVYIGQ